VRETGAKSIVCQMDPARTEVEMVREEEERWPGWAKRPVDVPGGYFAWRQAEWACADLVMVNSRWSREALVQQGVDADKIVIVPLAYEASDPPPKRVRAPDEELRVLFLGQVNLRKGVPYLLEAARQLRDCPVRFDIVGPIAIADEQVVKAPPNVSFHGAVDRASAARFYAEADVFTIPTISDGFALTQLEAMACSLPVVATPNCGDVVTDGLDGFLVPARDPAALAGAFRTMVEDPERLDAMGEAARATVLRFGLETLGGNLGAIEGCFFPGGNDDVFS
jgi:glycosyltransferase involved in cell wall biosynthesis